jgi:hypothetical protein
MTARQAEFLGVNVSAAGFVCRMIKVVLPFTNQVFSESSHYGVKKEGLWK